jgi:hypothetical protein
MTRNKFWFVKLVRKALNLFQIIFFLRKKQLVQVSTIFTFTDIAYRYRVRYCSDTERHKSRGKVTDATDILTDNPAFFYIRPDTRFDLSDIQPDTGYRY